MPGSLIFLMSSDAVGEINFASFRAGLKFGGRINDANGPSVEKIRREIETEMLEDIRRDHRACVRRL